MNSVPLLLSVFSVAAAISIFASGVLVVRLERIAHRLALTEAALGLLAAVAADAPEISSSVAALVHHDQGVGVGIIVGSNLFNLAALLGLASLLSVSLPISRSLSTYEGVPAALLALVVAASLFRVISAQWMLVSVVVVTTPYVLLALKGPERVRGRSRVAHLVRRALSEETADLDEVVPPEAATRRDVIEAIATVVLVVTASTVMERAGTRLGSRFQLSSLVVGGLVLAAVTSIPNVVAAVYLARRRRAAALISEASNSNTLNVVFGLSLPAVLAGEHFDHSTDPVVASFYLALTIVSYAAVWHFKEMRRSVGVIVIAGYLCFVGFASSH